MVELAFVFHPTVSSSYQPPSQMISETACALKGGTNTKDTKAQVIALGIVTQIRREVIYSFLRGLREQTSGTKWGVQLCTSAGLSTNVVGYTHRGVSVEMQGGREGIHPEYVGMYEIVLIQKDDTWGRRNLHRKRITNQGTLGDEEYTDGEGIYKELERPTHLTIYPPSICTPPQG